MQNFAFYSDGAQSYKQMFGLCRGLYLFSEASQYITAKPQVGPWRAQPQTPIIIVKCQQTREEAII